MKKAYYLWIPGIVLFFIISSCNKQDQYDIVGTYIIKHYYESGEDKTQQFRTDYGDYFIRFTPQNAFTEDFIAYEIAPVTINGIWSISDKDELDLISDNSMRVLQVVSMSSYELRLTMSDREYVFLKLR